MSYFSKLEQKTVILNNKKITVPNLFNNINFNQDLINDKNIYKDYYNENCERPDTLAFKFYNNYDYYWIILITNNITADLWALTNEELNKYIEKKYINPDEIKHYETKNVYDYEGNLVLKSGFIANSHDSIKIKINGQEKTGSTIFEPVTYRQYENRKNENRKQLKILKPDILSSLNL